MEGSYRPPFALVDPLSVTLPLLFPQHILLDLARTRLWQLVDDLNGRRTLEACHTRLAKRNQCSAVYNLVLWQSRL